jgi:transposase-like protein
LYRVIDEDGQVVDVLLRDHRDTASAEAFFRQAIERAELVAKEVVTDHHQPYVKTLATTCPECSAHPDGLHRARGQTAKAIERSHVPIARPTAH